MTRRAFLHQPLSMQDDHAQTRVSFLTQNTENSTNLDKKSRNFRLFFSNFIVSKTPSRALADTLKHSVTILEASWKLPASFRETRKFMKISKFRGHQKKLCSIRYFATAHRQTQRLHFWIARDLRCAEKLLPCKTNSQILRLGARGKPPTIIYCAGWLVEPFFSNYSQCTIIHLKIALHIPLEASKT